jgi:hypothetical protein
MQHGINKQAAHTEKQAPKKEKRGKSGMIISERVKIFLFLCGATLGVIHA